MDMADETTYFPNFLDNDCGIKIPEKTKENAVSVEYVRNCCYNAREGIYTREPTDEEIGALAYHLYVVRGSRAGFAEFDWSDARMILSPLDFPR